MNNDHQFRDNNKDIAFCKKGESDNEPEPEDDNIDDDEFDIMSGEYI